MGGDTDGDTSPARSRVGLQRTRVLLLTGGLYDVKIAQDISCPVIEVKRGSGSESLQSGSEEA